MSQTCGRQLTDNTANKRPVEEILSGLMPSKSKDDYEKAWKQFILFTEKEGEKPTESDYIQPSQGSQLPLMVSKNKENYIL